MRREASLSWLIISTGQRCCIDVLWFPRSREPLRLIRFFFLFSLSLSLSLFFLSLFFYFCFRRDFTAYALFFTKLSLRRVSKVDTHSLPRVIPHNLPIAASGYLPRRRSAPSKKNQKGKIISEWRPWNTRSTYSTTAGGTGCDREKDVY